MHHHFGATRECLCKQRTGARVCKLDGALSPVRPADSSKARRDIPRQRRRRATYGVSTRRLMRRNPGYFPQFREFV